MIHAERGTGSDYFTFKGGGGLGNTTKVSAPITTNGAIADQSNLAAILTEQAREMARQVKRVFEIEYEQEAVVWKVRPSAALVSKLVPVAWYFVAFPLKIAGAAGGGSAALG